MVPKYPIVEKVEWGLVEHMKKHQEKMVPPMQEERSEKSFLHCTATKVLP